MDKKEFNRIVDDAVANGADQKDAEAYVRAGYKLDDETDPYAKAKTPSSDRASANLPSLRGTGKPKAKKKTPPKKALKR